MNVRVSVKRSVGEQLVIPKTAVVLRSGKQVVFTLILPWRTPAADA